MKILAFSGAGISAESGIPTFRTDNGLWENHRVEDVCTPEAFERNPQLVWNFYRERYISYCKAQPNAGHYAIAYLENFCRDKGIEFLNVTQNVDELFTRAGASAVQLHGNISKFKCFSKVCGYTTDSPLWCNEQVPHCPQCNAEYLRPDIVWFNEELPFDALKKAYDFAKEADEVLAIGTSLQVFPAADLVMVPLRVKNAMVHEFNIKSYLSGFAADERRKYQWWAEPSSVSLPKYVNKLVEVYGECYA